MYYVVGIFFTDQSVDRLSVKVDNRNIKVNRKTRPTNRWIQLTVNILWKDPQMGITVMMIACQTYGQYDWSVISIENQTTYGVINGHKLSKTRSCIHIYGSVSTAWQFGWWLSWAVQHTQSWQDMPVQDSIRATAVWHANWFPWFCSQSQCVDGLALSGIRWHSLKECYNLFFNKTQCEKVTPYDVTDLGQNLVQLLAWSLFSTKFDWNSTEALSIRLVEANFREISI